jgi:adenosine deaminase
LGLKKVAHAGEEGPPEYVWQAMELLKVARIDHGNRALEEPELVEHLVKTETPLTVCPLSNLSLAVVDKLENHPLKIMLDAGLVATVNSDDPAYFGGYLNANYLCVAQALNLSESQILLLVQNSFTASFLSSDEIALRLSEVERCLNHK